MGFSRKSSTGPLVVEKVRSSSYSSLASDSTTASAPTAPAAPGTRSPSVPRRSGNVNVYTHCGRHSNEYLFGGHSLSGLARSIFKRSD
ncbi:hypothetical protein HYQ45_015768 [Verticillium longisporum]|uniref:Uncharacterized protein n=2 Tax=Verticillium TaxID=1036719 RepID=A0A8I2Z7V2_VERLO|nr:hypothetical protein VdG1_04389 [Verticillium dahliae VDG1]KAG7117674.1 hypothetical protein HYQ45_015768 [Verticillium longisporum]PNH45838.1 hypothetical protein VD0004_g2178 [Verticillium dahliae]PNH74473.1 hypothetical protein VD0001_g3099 [Verticillium dahliae]RBQ74342.1 hypothetical protein VDGD_21391 [Verticillium dahliae]